MNNNSTFKFDYHLHSCFSSDCETAVEDIIKTSKDKGLSSICITDHYDMDFPDNPDGIEFELDIDDYISKLKQFADSTDSIKLLTGLEQGVMPSTCSKLNNYSKEHPGLDFIICSSHVVDGADPYYDVCWFYPDGSPKDANTLYMNYYEDMLYNVQNFDDYNVYGHIDYIFRYGPNKINSKNFAEEYYSRFKDILHEILKTIILKGKGIEINTGSLYRGLDYMHPHPLILSMYKELGGEILTIGSDAHDLEHIGYGFNEAVELARSVGFKYLTTFKEMKPEWHTL